MKPYYDPPYGCGVKYGPSYDDDPDMYWDWFLPCVAENFSYHPCPKPLALYKELIGAFAQNNEVVCDPFMGTGTTLRAAKEMGKSAIGIEIEEKYCEIAAKRLSQEVFDFSVQP